MSKHEKILDPKTGKWLVVPSAEEEARINAGIAADPDTRELSDAEFAQLKPHPGPGRPRLANPKQRVTIRLSAEVAEHFRATGKGWQTRIDEVLRDYVQRERREA